MDLLKVTVSLPVELGRKLTEGAVVRCGGLLSDAATGDVVAFLRELGDAEELASKALGVFGAAGDFGVLNLGISTMGFAMVLKRLAQIEQQLKRTQELLQAIDRKLDLSFYANFRAALDLAGNAFTMAGEENKKTSAMQAINRFMEAKYYYFPLADQELSSCTPLADKYLATLSLAYVAEARCYLELEELERAAHLLQGGADELGRRTRLLVTSLLTASPSAYLHPALKDDIDLRRLTRVFRWIEPGLDEPAVFEKLRGEFFSLGENSGKWLESLPPAVWEPQPAAGAGGGGSGRLGWIGSRVSRLMRDEKQQAFGRLPSVLRTIEALIEDSRRFDSYRMEVKAIRELGLSFHEWQRLAPGEDGPAPQGAALAYIIPSVPLGVAA